MSVPINKSSDTDVIHHFNFSCDLYQNNDDDLITSFDKLNFEDIDDDMAKFASDKVIHAALHNGIHIHKFCQQVDEQIRSLELESIRQYVKESESSTELFHDIESCETKLYNMQKLLNTFQQQLHTITNDIQKEQMIIKKFFAGKENREAIMNEIKTFK